VIFQLTAPLLDGCVLAILEREDAYGYSLTQRLKREIDISESTLYPVLRRLQREGCLTVYDRQFQGRNRRYYAITPTGRELLDDCRRSWADYTDRVGRILSGGTRDE
jgi:PadR family transcriptional regulator PadR